MTLKKGKIRIDTIFERMIRPIIQAQEKKFFGSRNAITKNQLALFEKEIKQDLESLRARLSIPVLRESKDSISYDIEGRSISSSRFLDSLEDAESKNIRSVLEALIERYELPPSMYEWCEYYLLYAVKPGWDVNWHWEISQISLRDTPALEKLSLTSGEKTFVKEEFRRRLNIGNGRIPKQFAVAYSVLEFFLGKSKNAKRRKKSLDKLLEIERRHKSKSYAGLVLEDFSTEEEMDNDEKNEARYRKGAERLRKLKNNITPLK